MAPYIIDLVGTGCVWMSCGGDLVRASDVLRQKLSAILHFHLGIPKLKFRFLSKKKNYGTTTSTFLERYAKTGALLGDGQIPHANHKRKHLKTNLNIKEQKKSTKISDFAEEGATLEGIAIFFFLLKNETLI